MDSQRDTKPLVDGLWISLLNRASFGQALPVTRANLNRLARCWPTTAGDVTK